METSLNRLREGQVGRVTKIALDGALKQRLRDFGLIEGTMVECLHANHAGSPILYRVRGTMLALRACDSRCICVVVEPCE